MVSAPCGTPGGYRAHLRRGEPTCDPCKAAIAAYRRNARKTGAGQVGSRRPLSEQRGIPAAFAGLQPPQLAAARRLTAEQLDALCGGAPTVMVACPQGCGRQVGPYYDANSADARKALSYHEYVAHTAVWTSVAVGL